MQGRGGKKGGVSWEGEVRGNGGEGLRLRLPDEPFSFPVLGHDLYAVVGQLPPPPPPRSTGSICGGKLGEGSGLSALRQGWSVKIRDRPSP